MPTSSGRGGANILRSNLNDVNGPQCNINNHIHIPNPPPSSVTGYGNSPSLSSTSSADTTREWTGSAPHLYTGNLLTRGHGYPLWFPEPSSIPPTYKMNGVRVGDVGVITFDGQFEFIFNICLPSNHSINYYAPPDFIPLQSYDEQHLRKQSCAHSPGCVIANPALERELFDPHLELQYNR
jgi:hypothetical protein